MFVFVLCLCLCLCLCCVCVCVCVCVCMCLYSNNLVLILHFRGFALGAIQNAIHTGVRKNCLEPSKLPRSHVGSPKPASDIDIFHVTKVSLEHQKLCSQALTHDCCLTEEWILSRLGRYGCRPAACLTIDLHFFHVFTLPFLGLPFCKSEDCARLVHAHLDSPQLEFQDTIATLKMGDLSGPRLGLTCKNNPRSV